MIFSKYIFDHLFHWKGIYYGQMYPKTCFWILISPPEPKKTTKKGYFWKIENYSFLVKFGDFKQKCGQKLCIMMYLSSMQFMHMVPVTFGYFFCFFSNLSKMTHFWLNWKCSVGGFPMCRTLPEKILWNLNSKIP